MRGEKDNWRLAAMSKQIMVVDDNVDMLALVDIILKRGGFAVQRAQSGFEALDMLQQTTPDLFLLDMMMPGMDGIDTLKEIKKGYPLVEVIMLTGHATVESAVEGLKSRPRYGLDRCPTCSTVFSRT